MIVPIISLGAGASAQLANFVNTLPASLDIPRNMAERSRLLNADGTELATFYDENRVYVPLDKISEIMQKAQIAIEDHRFREHGAIDMQGTLRAMVSTSQGVTQGGSSITQQLVRLEQIAYAEATNDPMLKELATENTLERKIRELRYAIGREQNSTKDEILESYLNISYYGGGAYGVQAAARYYFGVSADKLDLPQAAMLAGLVRNPVATNPVTHPEIGVGRRNDVLNRMAQLGVITRAEAEAAKAVPFDASKVRENRKGCANSKYPFICDYAEQTIIQKATSLGATNEERKERLYRGGLTIRTQIDLKVQKKAEKTIADYISPKDPALSVITFLEPGTGQIVAMAQSRPKMGDKKGQTYWNYAVEKSMKGADGFQGGSTFKAFVAGAALEEDLGASWSTNVKSVMDFKGWKFESCDGPFEQRDSWRVAGGAGNNMNVFEGIRRSVNGFFVQLESAVGMCPVVKFAKKAGLKLASGEDLMDLQHYYPSFTLGAAEVTPLSLTEAYATFAARGIHCDPVILSSIKKTSTGAEFDVPSANCKRVMSTEIADGLTKVLAGSINSGTSRPAKVYGIDMAGKTGTVNGNGAIWTVAYNPALVGSAVIAADNSPTHKKFWKQHRNLLGGVVLPASGTYVQGLSGQNAGGWLLKPVFASAIKDRKPGKFHEPPADVLRGKQVAVPGCTGRSVSSCKAVLQDAGFQASVAGKKVFSDDAAKGDVAKTSPSGRASFKSMIVISVSKGPKPEPEVEVEPPDQMEVIDPANPVVPTNNPVQQQPVVR